MNSAYRVPHLGILPGLEDIPAAARPRAAAIRCRPPIAQNGIALAADRKLIPVHGSGVSSGHGNSRPNAAAPRTTATHRAQKLPADRILLIVPHLALGGHGIAVVLGSGMGEFAVVLFSGNGGVAVIGRREDRIDAG